MIEPASPSTRPAPPPALRPESPRTADGAPPLAAVALLSAAAVGYEILLTRLFSIIQWHHFAYMIISVALLGYGAAGTFVALCRQSLLTRYGAAFATGAALFGITSIAGFGLAQRVAFDPLEILWDPAQPLRLVAVYGLLLVPFFCAATSICLTFTRFAAESPRIYSFDIIGAGAGSLGILALLFLRPPADALTEVGALGLVAAAIAAFREALRPRWLAAALLAAALLLPVAMPTEWTRLRPSEYKDLSQMLAVVGSRVVAEHSNPLSLVTVVENRQVPLRYAPGMSLAAAIEPPPQLAIFADGDGPSALVRYDGRKEPIAYLGELTSALPYHLLARPRVLVLGAGAGADVLQALYHDAASVDAVELDPRIVALAQEEFADFSGRPFSAPGVRVHIGEARGYVAATDERYDLIQVALLDAFGASTSGLRALAESYLYTVEALREYYRHLEPGGMLAITRWVDLPPRDVLKLFATAVVAIEAEGGQPARQLALVRGWRTATLLVRNGAFTEREIASLREFARARSFDVAWFPGIDPAEVNRYNVLDRPWFHEGAVALLGPDRDEFVARYKFDLTPSTDDRPYFFHFFRWRTLPELVALKGRGGLPMLEWGYPVLVATLVQATIASLVLILLPLWAARRRRGDAAASASPPAQVGSYFAALGFAFMFVEIAFIQKFLLLLAHPLYAVAVVLSSFLVFAGIGSRLAGRRTAGAGRSSRRDVATAAIAIAIVAIAYLVALPPLFRTLMPLPDPLKIALSIALIAPLALAMGMPFPLGLARIGDSDPALTPWAWGVNGCASVVAAIVATLLAVHFGFTVVVLLAVLLYALAARLFP